MKKDPSRSFEATSKHCEKQTVSKVQMKKFEVQHATDRRARKSRTESSGSSSRDSLRKSFDNDRDATIIRQSGETLFLEVCSKEKSFESVGRGRKKFETKSNRLVSSFRFGRGREPTLFL